jgi:histidine triad (HIT) family protein
MARYDDQNIFAKILRGEITCFEVFRDERSFAFLDIMPRSPGHTLVVPRAPARSILDIADDDLAAVALTAKRIAVAAMKAFDAEGIISASDPAAVAPSFASASRGLASVSTARDHKVIAFAQEICCLDQGSIV